MMRRAAVGAVAVALVLSGCEGDDGETGAATPTTATSVPSVRDVAPPTAPPPTAPLSGDDSNGDADPATTPPSNTSGPSTGPPDAGTDPPPDSGPESLGPLGSTEVDLTSEDGTVQIGSADLPGLADGFPLPEGTALELASETTTDAGFSGVAPGSVLEQADFFREALPAAGFTIIDERRPTGDDDPDPAVVLFSFETADRDGELAITSAPGGDGSSIIVTINRR